MPNQHEDDRRRYRSSRFDDEHRDAMSGGASRRGRSSREVSRDEWSDRDSERYRDRPPSGSSGGYEGVRDADYGGYGSGYGRGGGRYGGDFGSERGAGHGTRYGEERGQGHRRSGRYGGLDDDEAMSGGSRGFDPHEGSSRGRSIGGQGMGRGGGWFGRPGGEHANLPGGGTARGKGPKGYTRADERIREDVCDCLTDDWDLDASDIEVQVKDGEVTLAGSVQTRSAKRHAEDLVEQVSGVKNVQNSLRVKESEANPAGRSGAT